MNEPIIETCDLDHKYYKEAGSDTRCPHCLAIGLAMAHAETARLIDSVHQEVRITYDSVVAQAWREKLTAKGEPMNGIYKVKTKSGYFYATSNGRYGRFGEFQDGWRLCKPCADRVVESLSAVDMEPELEQVQPWHCQSCQAKGKAS